MRYKARLVAKGFTQQLGQDYNKTYAPVIQMDTLRVILALVLVKKLKVHQMDIKGAYLNGILKETIYMDQPEWFNDETRRVCHLIKSIYGLKQSGREWNTKLDKQLTCYGLWKLISGFPSLPFG